MIRRQVRTPASPVPEYWRPKTRADCIDGPRPCPYVGCRYHLLLDVSKSGGLHIVQPDPLQFGETCALDMAARNRHAVCREISDVMGVTMERVRQLEQSAMRKVLAYCKKHDVRVPDGVWDQNVDGHYFRG